MTEDYASVGLVVSGQLLDPSTMTEAAGIAPARAWPKGHKYLSRSGQELEKHTGLWAVECERKKVADAAVELLAMIEPRMKEIRTTAADAKAEISVSIWWEPSAGQGGFDLDSVVVTRLAALGARVSVYLP